MEYENEPHQHPYNLIQYTIKILVLVSIAILLTFCVGWLLNESVNFLIAATCMICMCIIVWIVLRISINSNIATIVTITSLFFGVFGVVSNHAADIITVGRMVGVPVLVVKAISSLSSTTIDLFQLIFIVTVIATITRKYGWRSIIPIWAFQFLFSMPFSVVLANGFSDAPPGSYHWAKRALSYVPQWDMLVVYSVLVLICVLIFRTYDNLITSVRVQPVEPDTNNKSE